MAQIAGCTYIVTVIVCDSFNTLPSTKMSQLSNLIGFWNNKVRREKFVEMFQDLEEREKTYY